MYIKIIKQYKRYSVHIQNILIDIYLSQIFLKLLVFHQANQDYLIHQKQLLPLSACEVKNI